MWYSCCLGERADDKYLYPLYHSKPLTFNYNFGFDLWAELQFTFPEMKYIFIRMFMITKKSYLKYMYAASYVSLKK